MIKLAKRHNSYGHKNQKPLYTFQECSDLLNPSSRFGIFEEVIGYDEELGLSMIYSTLDEDGHVELHFEDNCEQVLCFKNQKLVAIAFMMKSPDPSQCRIDIIYVKKEDKTSALTNILLEKCYSWLDPLKPAIITLSDQKEFSNSLH